MSDQPRVSAEEVFNNAADIVSPSERAAYLDRACAGDPALRAEVEQLLRLDANAGSFLEKPPVELDVTALSDGHDVSSGEAWRELLGPCRDADSLGSLGQYEVLELVGRGGMGVVLRARDSKLNRAVAVKLLSPELAANAMAVRRFLREAQAAAAVSHDHVVTIHAIDEQARPPLIVMEYVEGQSLQQKIDAQGALDVKSILRIGLQTAAGLAAAHRQGLVHRDIKPSNILLENGVERVKLTDFGLARAVDDIGVTRTGQITGTPQYMSPEQAQGKRVDHRTDLFSLGCVLYAMCTGQAAFRADSAVAVMHRVVHDAPRPIREINEEIPEWMCAIVDKLLDKDPDQRFASAKEVEDLLGGHLAHLQQPDSVPQPQPIERPTVRLIRPTDEGRQFAWITFLGLGVACVLAFLVLATLNLLGRGLVPLWVVIPVLASFVFSAVFVAIVMLRRPVRPEAGKPLGGKLPMSTPADFADEFDFDPSVHWRHRLPFAAWLAGVLFAALFVVAALDGAQVLDGHLAQLLGVLFFFTSVGVLIVWILATVIRRLHFAQQPFLLSLLPSRLGVYFATVTVLGGALLALWADFDFSDPLTYREQLVRYHEGRAIAPWEDFRWDGEIAYARIDGTWYEVKSIQQIPPADAVTIADSKFAAPRRKVVEELVDVLIHMDRYTGRNVHLELRYLSRSDKLTEQRRVEMTKAKRDALLLAMYPGGDRDQSVPTAETAGPPFASTGRPSTADDSSRRETVPGEPVLAFDGRDDAVQLPFGYRGTHPFTVEAWVTVAAVTSGENRMLVSDVDSSQFGLTKGLLFFVSSKGQLMFGPAGGFPLAISQAPIPLAKRIHVAGVIDGRQARLFIDGQLVGSADVQEYRESARRLVVGANPNDAGFSECFLGSIHELRFSDSARYQDAFEPPQRFASDEQTWALYHLDEGSGTTAHDASGNGFDATITGAQWQTMTAGERR